MDVSRRSPDGMLRASACDVPTVVRSMRMVAGEGGLVQVDTQAASVRVAIASHDGARVDAHFALSRRMLVYEVSRRSHRLVQVIGFSADEAEKTGVEPADRIAVRIAALAGCHLLFVTAIGPPAAAQVIRANIHPLKVAPEAIERVIGRVQRMMQDPPPPWLRKLLAGRQPN